MSTIPVRKVYEYRYRVRRPPNPRLRWIALITASAGMIFTAFMLVGEAGTLRRPLLWVLAVLMMAGGAWVCKIAVEEDNRA